MADFRLFDPVGDASLGSTGIQGFTGIEGGGATGATGVAGTAGVQGVTGIGAGGGAGFFTDGSGPNSAIGKGATAPTTGLTSSNSLAQGNNVVVVGSNTFALGNNIYTSGSNVMAVGDDINYPGFAGINGSFLQGYGHNGGGFYSFVQGYGHTLGGTHSFMQGYDCETEGFGYRMFVQGARATARLSDQKVWGSNRTGTNGGAQSSRLIKHLQTSAASAATILTFPTEANMAYGITFTVTGIEGSADPAGASVIVSAAPWLGRGSSVPVASITTGTTSTTDIGSLSGSTFNIIASGANLLFQVTPASGSTAQWCADIQIVEVRE